MAVGVSQSGDQGLFPGSQGALVNVTPIALVKLECGDFGQLGVGAELPGYPAQLGPIADPDHASSLCRRAGMEQFLEEHASQQVHRYRGRALADVGALAG